MKKHVPSPANAASCCVAMLTPPGRGAVATIVVQGERATDIVEGCFQAAVGKPLTQFPLDRIVFGAWQSGQFASEELVVSRRDENRVEIHCHGGLAAVEKILHDLTDAGCQKTDWQQLAETDSGDFLATEAIIALSQALTKSAALVLLDQYHGALRTEIETIIGHLEKEPFDLAARQLELLASRARFGARLTQPWRIVLTGSPNVGKSSLINTLLGYRRAIVYDQPGTTRDVLTAATALGGWPVELSDTAGLRTSDDPLEAEGVRLATAQLEQADVALLVFAAELPWSDTDQDLLAQFPQAMVVHNKYDLVAKNANTAENRPPGIAVSAMSGEGIEKLIESILARLIPQLPPAGSAVPFTRRQTELICAAHAEVGQRDTLTAQTMLGKLLDNR